MEALDIAWYGSWRSLTNLTQTFRACHLCNFNVAAIFFGAIPIYDVLPYAMILEVTTFGKFWYLIVTGLFYVFESYSEYQLCNLNFPLCSTSGYALNK